MPWRKTIVCGAVLLLGVLFATARAQEPAWQLAQGSDGSLYLLHDGEAQPITPVAIGDDDLAALPMGDAIPDGQFSPSDDSQAPVDQPRTMQRAIALTPPPGPPAPPTPTVDPAGAAAAGELAASVPPTPSPATPMPAVSVTPTCQFTGEHHHHFQDGGEPGGYPNSQVGAPGGYPGAQGGYPGGLPGSQGGAPGGYPGAQGGYPGGYPSSQSGTGGGYPQGPCAPQATPGTSTP